MNNRPRPRIRWWAVLSPLAVGVLCTWGVWPSGAGAPPTSVPAPAGTPPSPVAPPAVANAAAPTAAEPLAREAAEPGLHGVLLDNAGVPLAGWAVDVVRVAESTGLDRLEGRRHPTPGTLLRTDAEGRFGATVFSPGDYRVMPQGVEECGRDVHLVAGGAVECELRFPPGLVAVLGTLTRHGEVDTRHAVAFQGAGRDAVTALPVDGVVRTALHAGSYRLSVMAQLVALRRYELRVPEAQARMQWTFEVGGTDVEVAVDVGPERNGHVFGVDINGTPAIGEQDGYFADSGKVGEPVRFELPPGHWTVHVHSPTLTGLVDQVLDLAPTSPPQRLTFAAGVGAEVVLRIAARDGRLLAVPGELMPPLRVGGVQVPLTKAGLQAARYRGVPLGEAELLLEDRVEADAVAFLPFEPQPPVHLAVVDREGLAIDLSVAPRAFVDLRACTASGIEDITACLEVFAGERRVRGRDERQNQRWSGWLPRGTYRVRIDRSGAVGERFVDVAGDDLTLRLRP